MSNSLRDQLLGLGFKPAPKPERKPEPRSVADARKPKHPTQGRPNAPAQAKTPHRSQPSKPRSQEEIDLAKAYSIRAQKEKNERIEAERLKQEEARVRREAKAQLAELLKDKALNDAAAEIARHFAYGGKIKRIRVTEAQLKALNAGELGVVQDGGRYVLVDLATLIAAETIFPAAVALRVDLNAPIEADPYADPQYQVPDDLVW